MSVEDPGPPPEQVAELTALLRSGRLSRFRLLDVACPNDQRLAQVLTTPRGPLFVAQVAVVDYDAIDWEYDGKGGVLESWRLRHREAVHTAFLDEEPDNGSLEAQCRCRNAEVPVAWLRERLQESATRVVWAQKWARVIPPPPRPTDLRPRTASEYEADMESRADGPADAV